MSIRQEIIALLENRIMIIDGAMGTMIQKHQLQEEDYRGERFKDWHSDLKGNNDLLCLTQPQIIQSIHRAYLDAGADFIETNTFNAQKVSLADYQMEHLAFEINFEAARLAKSAVEAYLRDHQGQKKYVAGAIGPMNKTLSMSPDVNQPGFRSIYFDEVVSAYLEQIDGLVKGGADVLLIETIFDTLNAKAAIFAINQYFRANDLDLPVMISGTITDASGRTLSGQTLEAFLISVSHANPISIGLNCALGADQMRPYIEELSNSSPHFVSCYPNAGLPNVLGQYDETPEKMAKTISEFAKEGWINLVGGCCGTTPEHIKAITEQVKLIPPRGKTTFNYYTL